jgi:sulfoxide reductase heme-binding subunit YedZ
VAGLSHKTRLRLEKTLVFLLLLSPLAVIGYKFFSNGLGANPVEAATHRTGLWALRFLLLSLLITPLRILWHWRRPLLFRRMVGLFAFAYAVAHFAVYLVFDQELDFSGTWDDVVKRPYITIGFTALVLMIPLAATSNSYMLKKLGAKRWRLLHKLSYAIAIFVVIHFIWSVKADVREPLTYAGILAALFAIRGYEKVKAQRAKRLA